jgi:hypothetical protein
MTLVSLPRKWIIGSEPYAWSIGMDDPVPLQVAAEIFFPAGGVTEQSLRTEIRKGRLAVERIAGKDFVTKRAIDEMRERCRNQLRVLD